MFDTLRVFLKECFEKVESSRTTTAGLRTNTYKIPQHAEINLALHTKKALTFA